MKQFLQALYREFLLQVTLQGKEIQKEAPVCASCKETNTSFHEWFYHISFI